MSVTAFQHYATDALLRDGGSIHIRAIRPDDKQRLLALFERLSSRSIYFRFFQTKQRLTDEELRYFTELDFTRDVALVATLQEGLEEHIIGVGRYFRIYEHEQPTSRAEVAFTVADTHQGRGVGTLLLEHLAIIARRQGIDTFEAYVLGENNRMLEVFEASGFTVQRALDTGVFHVSFPTADTPQVRAASMERERLATAQSMRALLNPRSVAVVGVSQRGEGAPLSWRPSADAVAGNGAPLSWRPSADAVAGEGVGAALLANLQRAGFPGRLYPIHLHATVIQGLPAFPRVSAVGAPVDLALIAVPAAAVEEVVADCATAGVHGVVVLSSGFAEASAAGREAEQRLRALVRASGMRLVGPNCMGLLNTDPQVALNATFTTPVLPLAGNIGMLSQSGALGLAMLDYVQSLHVGLSTFVSIGNRADVSNNDMLAYWADDPRTDVIVLYLESFGNPRHFARLAPDVARRKPIIAVKSGRSAAGSRAAASHSAALATSDTAVDALFEQAGVIRANTLQELFDVAVLLSTQPLPPGPRVGVVTNAGGPAILLADMGETHGLVFPDLTPETTAALRALLPPQAGLANPIDMIAAATPAQYARTIELVGADPNIDALIVIYIPPLVTEPAEIAQAIAAGAGTVPASKPVLTVFMTSQGVPAALNAGPRRALPTYTFPENAALALSAAVRYGHWRTQPCGTPSRLSPFAHSAVRAVVDRVLANASAPLWLPPGDVAAILQAAGSTLAAAEQTSPAEAVATAERLGYPLVAKVVSPDVLHKSDVGGVILGLDTPAAVASAVETLVTRMHQRQARLDGILLQRQVASGIEALVGVTTDPTFGPLLVCGLGGTLVEVVRDVAFRLIPVSDVEATAMLTTLRANVLLDGSRGAPPGDREALIALLLRVSALAESIPELQELDLNPVKVLAPGQGVIALDGRMRLAPLGEVTTCPTP
jgi:acyl-CoA synthetase (NDP forming)/RimJ/RimL family protein N-acetyltransferase